jgi:hypothetical protein
VSWRASGSLALNAPPILLRAERHVWTRARRAAAIAMLSAVTVAAVVSSRTDQSFYSDPAVQMKAVRQFVAGESSRPNDWARPDYADLSRTVSEQLIVFAPGTPLAFLPFVRAGVTPARAARMVAVLALVAGSIGWACWCARFNLPDTVLLAIALVFPWMRFASNALFLYSAEILAFAIVPWILMGGLAVERAKRGALAGTAVLGLAAGALYIVKYSATFVTAGVLAWLVWRTLRRDEPLARRVIRICVCAAAAALPVAALSALNQRSGGSANLMLATLGGHWRWAFVVHAVASPALAAADLDSLLMFTFMHPVHPVTQNVFWLSLAGLPGGVLLLVLAARARERTAAAELARAVLGVSIAAILVVWTLSSAVSIEARHLSSAGFAMLPLALAEGRAWWRDATPPRRRLLAVAACAFVIAPFAYGVASVLAKTWRYPTDYRPASSGIYNPLLAQQDAASVVEAFERDFVPATDVWYLVEPLTTLDLRGRTIVRPADFIELNFLRRERFLTSRRMRVHALLPPRFEHNGKGTAIRASFPQAIAWSRSVVPGAEYDAWTAVLDPSRSQEAAR